VDFAAIVCNAFIPDPFILVCVVNITQGCSCWYLADIEKVVEDLTQGYHTSVSIPSWQVGTDNYNLGLDKVAAMGVHGCQLLAAAVACKLSIFITR
jgi:hypothetical protein